MNNCISVTRWMPGFCIYGDLCMFYIRYISMKRHAFMVCACVYDKAFFMSNI